MKFCSASLESIVRKTTDSLQNRNICKSRALSETLKIPPYPCSNIPLVNKNMGFSTYNHFSSLGIKVTIYKIFSVHKTYHKRLIF